MLQIKLNTMKNFLIGFLIILAVSCNNDDDIAHGKDCDNSESGILKNFTGLDGCGWIIQLTDSTRLEPINWNEFDIELIENKEVCIQYRERIDLGSYCMVGKVVELDFVE